jgi:hypothetical protein
MGSKLLQKVTLLQRCISSSSPPTYFLFLSPLAIPYPNDVLQPHTTPDAIPADFDDIDDICGDTQASMQPLVSRRCLTPRQSYLLLLHFHTWRISDSYLPKLVSLLLCNFCI